MTTSLTDPFKANPWKRSCWLALRIYAALCTVLVSACIGLWLWSVLFQKPAPTTTGSSQALFITSYGAYMAAEYPERGNRFWSMAAAFREYVAGTQVGETDLFRYLGRPDQFYVTNEIVSKPGEAPVTNKIVLFAYLFDRPGVTNKWSATAVLEEGKVQDIGFSDASAIVRSGFKSFPIDPAPNQGAGPNERERGHAN